jgi:hypothetical protein
MSSSLSKKDLYALTLAKLKELAKEYDISGRSTYNASNKNELADKIHAAMKKRAKAAAGVVPVVIDPPAAGELDCNMPQKTCETSSKYKKPDILALARKCGVTNLEGTRKELCARIAQRLGPVPEPEPVAPEPQPVVAPPSADDGCNMPQKTCETSSKYKKPDILALARKCGVTNLEGTRKELCARIAAKMAGMVQPELVAPQPAPVVGGELDCNIPQKTCETSSKYKKNDILDLAKRCGVTDFSGTRKDLCARIAAKMAAGVVPEPPEPEPPVPEPPVPEPEPPVPEPPVPEPPAPEPPVVPVGPDCYGGKTYEELIEMKVDELRVLMDQAKILKNRPTNKKDMAAYLCAVQQNGRCDPENNVNCDGDLVCDVQAKVCLDRELAAKRNQQIVQINGKTIVGTPAAIAQLRKKLEAAPAPQPPRGGDGPQTPDKPPTPDEPPPGFVAPPPPPPPPPKPEKPVHGAEVVDIEEVLRQIQAGGDVGDISALSETQKAVFKCLGLIA